MRKSRYDICYGPVPIFGMGFINAWKAVRLVDTHEIALHLNFLSENALISKPGVLGVRNNE